MEGCCHGDLDKIYGTMQHLERMGGKKIDLLICCGDFQACADPPSMLKPQQLTHSAYNLKLRLFPKTLLVRVTGSTQRGRPAVSGVPT